MRHDALRPPVRRAAATGGTKLATRLSRGEKRNRKRMAEVGAVYDATPVAARTPADVLARSPDDDTDTDPAPAPVTTGKWLTASVIDDATTIVNDMFTEADRRDPDHHRTWIALVDGNNHQIDRITAEARTREVQVTILIDLCRPRNYADTGAGGDANRHARGGLSRWLVARLSG